ncbi:hypothetical protein BCR43DRAFT_494188 [Syncephalastrum racemosum]|uniref:Mitochondrial ATPase inhibitor, IATP-domain-containing protein n=1 Tax=Syncephalastrum racemosum TaxID=13706 RepID=A0A1X2H7K8_SYNRA|nr:hypothetical protein BCR43DRAFT_494188 [Syncephalastrum racemosum]
MPITALRRLPLAYARRNFTSSTAVLASSEDKKAAETAKKHVDKIRQEEANKEKHPSPVSPSAREKFNEMEKRTAEHDQKQK